jgi:hypothetical protein
MCLATSSWNAVPSSNTRRHRAGLLTIEATKATACCGEGFTDVETRNRNRPFGTAEQFVVTPHERVKSARSQAVDVRA